MEKVNISQVKRLREITSLPVMECKKALEKASGDIEKAKEILKKKGFDLAKKKLGREVKDGIIASYIHPGSKIGVLLEINCETDFVAKTADFQQLAKDLSLQIAATNPLSIRQEDLPQEMIEEKKGWWKEEFASKPTSVQEKIIAGKLEDFYKEIVLLDQPFVKEPEMSINDYLTSVIAKLGENITIRRFVRYELGK